MGQAEEGKELEKDFENIEFSLVFVEERSTQYYIIIEIRHLPVQDIR